MLDSNTTEAIDKIQYVEIVPYKSRNYLIFVAFLFKNEHKIHLILEYDSKFDND